ncbi:MAG: hypothetical protein C0404_08655 [Verrucomicrobia bacterium]|nr:hypothetical protein [Verrucomicrobiota bacterium]
MKIPLNMGQSASAGSKAVQNKLLERDVTGAAEGDWNCRNNLIRTFTPLISSLAQKRSSEVSKINQYLEAGKNGLFTAAKKFKSGSGMDNFHIFALDFIEKAMDEVDKGGGFFKKLFGG